MWPFKKKAKQPEPKSGEEKVKQNIELQVTFDPSTKQLKMKPKEPEQPPKKPVQPKEIKWECPTCKQAFPGRATRSRFKCPHCRNWVYFLGDDLMTKVDHGRLAEKYYQDRYEERYRERMGEDLTADLGLTEEMLQRREQELLRSTGVQPKKFTVILSLFNETILKVKDLHEMENRYYSLAIILNKAGEECFHILKALAKTKLAALKKEGYKNVSIITGRMCEGCQKVDGKVLSIEEALKTMPIPIRECENFPYNEKHSFCIVCDYVGEVDDEYWQNKP